MSNEETKDCTRLPVVAWLCEWMADKRGGVYSGLSKTSLEGLRRSQGEDVLIVSDEPLCRLTDAHARLAEKDARIAELELEVEYQNRVNMQYEKTLTRVDNMWKKRWLEKTGEPSVSLIVDDEFKSYFEQIKALKAQLEKLQAAPAERGVVVLPEPLKRSDEGGMGEYGAAMIRGYNACLREVARLNPAPAAADSDVREVK